MSQAPSETAAQTFRERFGVAPQWLSVAPGRINLIGEHTDYNDGFVFPVAIDRGLYVAALPVEDLSQIISTELGDGQEFDAATVEPGHVEGFSAYVAGIAWALREQTQASIPNLQAVIHSEVPIGSGVSSSAAIELAFAVIWNHACFTGLSNKDLALLSQRCENVFVGVRSGVMDQMASALGQAGMAMFLDTRSLEVQYVRLPQRLVVALCDTNRPRALTNSAYNERREQCEAACHALGVAALRDVDLEGLECHKDEMDETVYRRARHVVTENERCKSFVKALRGDDFDAIGRLMRESHESLRDDYEVTGPALDAMAEACWESPGCVGARMTGAGFGGACVSLVQRNEFEGFALCAAREYERRTGKQAAIMHCEVVDGARLLLE